MLIVQKAVDAVCKAVVRRAVDILDLITHCIIHGVHHAVVVSDRREAGINGIGWTVNATASKWTYTDPTGAQGGITHAVVRDRSVVQDGLLLPHHDHHHERLAGGADEAGE